MVPNNSGGGNRHLTVGSSISHYNRLDVSAARVPIQLKPLVPYSDGAKGVSDGSCLPFSLKDSPVQDKILSQHQ